MTEKELNRSLEIHQRLDRAYDMLESLEASVKSRAPLDGMPHGTDISDKVGNIAIAIADLRDDISKLEDELEISDSNIRAFANSFEDERIVVLLQLRFISGLTWGAVAQCMGYANEEPMKRLFYRTVLGKKYVK